MTVVENTIDYSDDNTKLDRQSQLNEGNVTKDLSLFARDATWSSWDSKEKIGEQEFLESDMQGSAQLVKLDNSDNVVKKESTGNSSSVEIRDSNIRDPDTISSASSSSSRSIKKENNEKHISIESLKDQETKFSKMSIDDDEVAKITESRITSVWIHPGSDKLIVAAADKDGHLG
jgi:hypothetical protein